jgi:hypothetical protein
MIYGLPGYIVGLGSLICFILVLVRQFQREGPVQGIIGIVTCGIWTFIWGWLNADRENIKSLMSIWSFFVIVSIIVRVLGFLSAAHQ